MKKVTPEINTFDVITTSYEVAAMKPLVKIYEETLHKLNLSPDECIYTDDILEYVEVARSLGMHGIHFKGYDDFVKSLADLKVIKLEK
jgi:HAD superfamily hydrolase (TIGR01509 family)